VIEQITAACNKEVPTETRAADSIPIASCPPAAVYSNTSVVHRRGNTAPRAVLDDCRRAARQKTLCVPAGEYSNLLASISTDAHDRRDRAGLPMLPHDRVGCLRLSG